MNRFLAVFFVVASVSAQGPPPQNACGCAPAPVVIQLSCGNGQGQAGMPPPPPAPAGPSEAENAFDQIFGPGTGLDDMDYIMNMCQFDENGFPTGHPVGGFPPGFRIGTDADGHPTPVAPEGFPAPSPYWDGTTATLGFPMPARGTPLFNMMMCWPFAVPVPTIG